MDIRHPAETELQALKNVWKTCFGDSDDYVDFYFKHAYASKNTLICTDGGQIAAMMTLLPALLGTKTHIYKGAYVYAVSTLPEFRKQGLMTKLDEAAEKLSQNRGFRFMSLVPAEEPLFTMYEKLGYRRDFFLSQQEITASDYRGKSVPTKFSDTAKAYFVKLRQMFLSTMAYTVQLDGYMQDYVYQELLKAGNRIITVQNKFGHGYIVFYLKDSTMVIREAGLPPACLYAALPELADYYGAEKFCIRFPAGVNEEPDHIKSYGMIKFLGEAIKLPANAVPYMNLMLD